MTEIISIINQKGGVGKSTTAQILGQGLKELYNKKVLLVDLDAQCNLSYTLGADTENKTIRDVLKNDCKILESIQHLETGDIIASSIYMVEVTPERPTALRDKLGQIAKNYDYIIIDTPPALSRITYNALTASTSVIIPALPDVFSLQGISQLYGTITTVKAKTNKDLKVSGILLTKYNDRISLNQSVAEQIEELAHTYKTKVFKARIRDSVIVREAQTSQESLFTYAKRAKVTNDYKALIKEVINDK